MNIIDNCKQTFIDAYNQCLELIQKNNVHVFHWGWTDYSTQDLIKYETLDAYIDAAYKFNSIDNASSDLGQSIDSFVAHIFHPDTNDIIVTDEELNAERKIFAAKREQIIKEYGSLSELEEKLRIAKEKSDAAFDEWNKLNLIKRGLV